MYNISNISLEALYNFLALEVVPAVLTISSIPFKDLYNVIVPELKPVAQTEDCKNNVSKAVTRSVSKTTNNVHEVIVDTGPVIVFDVDDTICKPLSSYVYTEDRIKEAKRLNPETITGAWWQYHYLCLPYLGLLFNYLIDHKARIVFFSDELKEGTVALLEQIMPQYLGEERYKLLKAKGQFKIFSEKDSTPISYIDQYEERRTKYIKDLNKVINGGDQRNAVLIDGDDYHVQDSQHPFIQPLSLWDWNPFSELEDNFKVFTKNGAYYLFGVFKEYFEKEQYSTLQLKDGLTEVFKERNVSIFKEFHTNPRNHFIREMIHTGLEKVKEAHPEAILYGEDRYFKEDPLPSKDFS